MGWRDRIGLGGDKQGGKPEPEKKAEEQAPAAQPRGQRARMQAEEDANKEVIGLLQQFVTEGLKHLQTKDRAIKPAGIGDFAEAGPRTRIQMRVPSQYEAHALQKLMHEALGLGADMRTPLQREACNTKPTYRLLFKTREIPKDRCKEVLERSLRHIGVAPDWKAHYFEQDKAEEERFREAMRQQDDTGRGRR